MFKKFMRLLGFKTKEETLEKRLFQSILIPHYPRDYFKWHFYK
ncbi:MAG: hypothetical protein ACOH5I_17995 [Oligoflexus sp.]